MCTTFYTNSVRSVTINSQQKLVHNKQLKSNLKSAWCTLYLLFRYYINWTRLIFTVVLPVLLLVVLNGKIFRAIRLVSDNIRIRYLDKIGYILDIHIIVEIIHRYVY